MPASGTAHPKWNFQSCCFGNDWICCGACWTIDPLMTTAGMCPLEKSKDIWNQPMKKKLSAHENKALHLNSPRFRSPNISQSFPLATLKQALLVCLYWSPFFFAFVTFIAFDWSSRNPIRRRKPIENPIIVFRQRRFVLVFVFHSSTYHNMEMLSVWGLCKCWDGFASMQFYTLHHFIIFLAHLANAYRSLTNRASRVLASFLLKYCLKFRRNTFYLCYPAQMLWTDRPCT